MKFSCVHGKNHDKNRTYLLTFLYQQLRCLNEIAVIENRNKNAMAVANDS